jgi:hypothetical protein
MMEKQRSIVSPTIGSVKPSPLIQALEMAPRFTKHPPLTSWVLPNGVILIKEDCRSMIFLTKK